jgi:hypothetical protein
MQVSELVQSLSDLFVVLHSSSVLQTAYGWNCGAARASVRSASFFQRITEAWTDHLRAQHTFWPPSCNSFPRNPYGTRAAIFIVVTRLVMYDCIEAAAHHVLYGVPSDETLLAPLCTSTMPLSV